MSGAVTPEVLDAMQVPGQITVHETHTGVVVLAGDRAYKSKKPVVTDFLDFGTVQRREHACLREIELNRRLAAGSYLGLAHLVGPEGGPGEPVIEMRRYPDDERLATIVRSGLPAEGYLDAVAQQIARLHADSAHSKQINSAGRRTAVIVRWEQNLAELSRRATTLDAGSAIAVINRLFRQYVDGRATLFAQRIDQCRIVDGHGDLQTADIFCTARGPVILDCLEFDDELRYVDGLDDASFLAMDLQFLGARDLAEYFLSSYRRAAGDDGPASLAYFYCAYRAIVRAKVDCIRMEQGHASARADALRHLELAVDNLRAATVRLVLVGGDPGTGKSTVARALGSALPATVISTDDVRAELVAAGRLDGRAGSYRSGRYSRAQVQEVYKAVLRKAGLLLAQGKSVILDGTWRDPDARECARAVGRENRCPIVELACTAPLDVALARIAGRRDSTSEVTPEIAAAMAHERISWPEAHRIDTTRPVIASTHVAAAICRSAF
ncbi:AAA family ATPase [Mycobacterium sp. CBMA293]|uniref:bifunctional aminoglycoside phosphotransferase/ATP-binding protein n=1 Tax=unclassified Mycolicibacterium TaxID=2636767 RepID=UPI0012DDC9C9|nr:MULTISPECIES: AAA family ATPase [unclassified Mycolicibacterium]MUL47121.1 AAA family ATPase [Mycolicibacterium sp. CBMA 360]MUL58498.1 AAA family ATPase [Mycolicibacterium sp. CBMA 335]MUL73956.1 AAA family ATPase [Mycolicibacterium sp. CBMA 311]MUL93381.1 AAA family ATPase [Mycolicibacterium sp. CBMA 230]MUM10224.1 AAA family ATPase [Mycolicibacterium sp. CBMA 293]